MSGIEINRDHEADDDGEIGGPMDVFWAEGHGHDDEVFLRAVLDECLGEGNVPAIRWEDRPVEMWQRDVPAGDSVIYHRAEEVPDGHRVKDWRPVTVLDLERRHHGATKCSIDGCTKPWSSGQPVQIVVDVVGPYRALTMWLCREHGREIPEPSYRLRFIPVGAVIQLPAETTTRGEK